ncbi:cation:proton antiporter [Rhodobacter sp. KR11]|uniref:cation:proton antiporter domain-containing protein n=1 Tax=Rhodobacter sp. KR11 TaxID=2974588 RepID=UPI002223D057|nr:cation:proton antiporter [Rhodobacter sp. KR11]MCW1919866.1 cation:proton antiporter [Rhodobacter sp. KR11]
MESFLLQASIYLGAAVLVVPLSIRLGLGSVLGYLTAGILMGPVMGLAGAETADLQHVAEFGVVLMLFLIGLELEPAHLWDMRKRLFGMGGLQVGLTIAALAGALFMAGEQWQVALALGMIGAMSSTAIVLQTLAEKNLMGTGGGRAVFSVLLAQDLAVVPILSIMPLLVLPEIATLSAETFGVTNPTTVAPHDAGLAEPLVHFVQGLPAWAMTTLTLAVVVAIVLVGHYVSRPIFRFVHAARLPEMSTFVSLLLVLGIAFLMVLVGLSPALGTFVAGVVLANSEFRHQLEADLQPFKGLLMGLFFMTVGVGVNFALMLREPLTIAAWTFGLIAIKAVILQVIARLFRLKPRGRVLFTLGLAQGGEFGFLVISVARSEGTLPIVAGQMAQLVISLSMLLTPLLFLAFDFIAKRLAGRVLEQPADAIDEKGSVIIAGIGRFGQVVNRLVRHSGVPTVVLDADPGMIETMRRFGVKGYYGDPSRPELLEAAGLSEARVLVVTVDDPVKAVQIVRFARGRRDDLHIVARARDRVHVYELYQAGANDIVRETFDSSLRAGRYVLENMGFSDYEASALSKAYFRMDRSAMRDLAELWVPGQPVDQNPAYVERAKQLDRDLETALIDEIYDLRPMEPEKD